MRIYYGPKGRETSLWWTVRVRDAKTNVEMNGSTYNALVGLSGQTIGCALSNVAFDEKNRRLFPHGCHLVYVVKSRVIVIDSLKKNGMPNTGVRYNHSYRHITDANDAGTLKKMVRENPAVMERSFLLRAPKKRSKASLQKGASGHAPGTTRKSSRVFIPRGALARAVKAGLISKVAVNQLSLKI
jgi:hypothetical protein